MLTTSSLKTDSGRWTRVHWPWLLIASGWGIALAAGAGGQDWMLNHHILIEGGRLPLLAAALVFLLAWQLMTVTMMLPSSVPLLRSFQQANDVNQGGPAATLAFLAGYAAVWTWFAVIAFSGDIMVHQLIHSWSWLAWHPWMIAGTTLLTAGAFQFTALKARCLAQCRAPFSFCARHYRRGTSGGWRLGLENGKMCLGCSWALMLVMFGLGVGNAIWMAGLAGVMFLERTTLAGRRLAPLLGAVLLAWGALVLVHPAWMPAALAGAA